MKERPIVIKFIRRNAKTALMMNKKTLRTIDRYRTTLGGLGSSHEKGFNNEITSQKAKTLILHLLIIITISLNGTIGTLEAEL